MKKFLSILAAVGLTATTSTAVVACSNKDNDKVTINTSDVKLKDDQKSGTFNINQKDAEKLELSQKDGDAYKAGKNFEKAVTGSEDGISFALGLVLNTKDGSVDATLIAGKDLEKEISVTFNLANNKKLEVKAPKGLKAAEKVEIALNENSKNIEVGKDFDVKNLISNLDKLGAMTYTIPTTNANFSIKGSVVTAKSTATAGMTIEVTINGTFAKESKKVTLTVVTPAEKKEFKVVDAQTVKIDATKEVTIENSDNTPFNGTLTAKPVDDTIATATIDGSKITIKGVKAGATTIAVSADGYTSINISVTVTQPTENKKFKAVANQTVKTGTPVEFTIANSDDSAFTGTLKATSADETTATVAVNGAKITITAVKAGDTTITVSADGYDSINISVTVTAA